MTSNPSRRRVVVTGLGVVSPLGLSVRETWSNALEGRSGVAPITLFDTKDCPVTFAGEVKGLDIGRPVGPFKPDGQTELTQACDRKEARKMGRFIHLGLAAGIEAYGDSGLDPVRASVDSDRIGVNFGVGMGGLPEIEGVHTDLTTKGYRRITPFFIPQVIPNMAGGHLSILLNLRGPNFCNATACSSSAHAIGEAYHQIARGEAEIMFAGGAESVVSPLGVGGFAAMKALSTRNEEPTKASRPFDAGRDGFVIGEGSAVLVLEELEHARKRGARIYAEVAGYGASADAYHMTTPAPEGEGGFRAMKAALTNSGLKPEQISYVNAHGTSTPAGDGEEATAVKKLFPNASKHLHVSSTKSMTGHLLGAAGALEALFSVLAVAEDVVPPTINLETLDEKCAATGLNFTANKAVRKPMEAALSNSFGFGGTNACLIFRKYKP